MLWLIFILGAIFAGFVQGLTGFAFALISMSFWVWVLPPQISAPMVVFASLWCHLISLSKESPPPVHSGLVLPYILAGLVAVPLGSYLLPMLNTQLFKMLLGLFLILWCPLMYFAPQYAWLQRRGKMADASIGFVGGLLGGLGGFCGAIPSAWLMLKNLPKAQQRYILRHFNFAIQLFTLMVYLIQQTIQRSHLPYMLLLMIFVSVPTILGAQLFYKISEQRFKQLVLALLFLSGCSLVITATFNI